MKKIFFLTIMSLSAVAMFGQTVMKIAGKEVSKPEFEYYYNKNVVGDSTKMSVAEYALRFINFKLKVADAYNRKMDTVSSFIKELDGYRNQLIPPYLTDDSIKKVLVKEQYARMLEDVDVSHILIRVAEDTTAAYNKAMEALKELERESFGKVAAKYSEDPSMAGDSGRIGYITALTTVYPFEVAAYNTPVGKYSGPVRTMFGYHIIKVNNRRPTRGQVKVAHIFKRKPIGAKSASLDSLKQVVYSLYSDIKNGKTNFADAAIAGSEDGAAKSGGELPWITTGKTNELFEDTAFAMDTIGSMRVIEAPYGWHIIKLLDKKPIDPIEDVTPLIESRMRGDERTLVIYDSFINKLKREYNFKQYSPVGADSVIASFADVKLTQDSLKSFIETHANLGKDTVKQFIDSSIFDYEKRNLEKKYPEFGLLMQEYKDGILMFNISQEEVWGKAAKDTTGLRKYFEAHKEDYAWDTPHWKGIIVRCASKDIKKQAQAMLNTVPMESATECLSNLNLDGKRNVKVEKGVFAKGKNKIVDAKIFKDGKMPEDSKYPEVFLVGKVLKKYPESYKDVRGPVLNDYQTKVENDWISILKKKYKIEVYMDILDSISDAQQTFDAQNEAARKRELKKYSVEKH